MLDQCRIRDGLERKSDLAYSRFPPILPFLIQYPVLEAIPLRLDVFGLNELLSVRYLTGVIARSALLE